MKDYAWHLRQRLIQRDEDPRKLHYQGLISRGLSETDAANMSGWHPLDEWEGAYRILWIVSTVACILALLMAWNVAGAEVMDSRDQIKSLMVSESSLISCINGEGFKLSDGSEFICVRMK